MRIIKLTLCYLKIFLYCVESVFDFNLGDTVIYQNKEYSLLQGVCNPSWDLLSEDGKLTRVNGIHKSKFRKKFCWYNLHHAFEFKYRFYKGYWLNIWTSWSFREIVVFTLKNHKWFNYGKRSKGCVFKT